MKTLGLARVCQFLRVAWKAFANRMLWNIPTDSTGVIFSSVSEQTWLSNQYLNVCQPLETLRLGLMA